MSWAAKIDEYGKGAWIALTILGFWVAWPIGLATLIFAAASGRLFSGNGCGGRGRWYNTGTSRRGGCGWGGSSRRRSSSSGNAAFDEYREQTLTRLEEEQKEFVEYLERLRRAKDREEFEQFMAERRNRPAPNPSAV